VKILLIHPEGGVNYNANLSGLMEVLTEAGHLVTYVAPRRSLINQELNLPGVTAVLVDEQQQRGRFLYPDEINVQAWSGHDLVLAVDRGIIEGDWIARQLRIPKALLSYEIFFGEETPADFKLEEIVACRDLSFAVCQDSLRARKLCLANDIPPDKVLLMPVAGRRFREPRVPKPRLLHEMFQLPESTKIALHMGSFADWTGASFLLNSTRSWPDDWVLVLHERFGRPVRHLVEKDASPQRVRISETTFAKPDDMTAFVQSADLGVALYCPTYETEWVGRNILHMGLSSGKISQFLQSGVPVATHEIGEIADWIRFYKAGQVFSLDRPFVPELPADATPAACQRLFERHLDLDRFAPAMLKTLSALNQ
jgi:hypothetical protein